MRLVYITLVTGFIAVVAALVIIYKPAANPNRADEIAELMQPEVRAKTGTSVPAPAPGPKPAAVSPAAPTESAAVPTGETGAPSPDAASTLKDEHERENVTQFDRALLFLAPAAPSPMIEQPIATAAAAPAIPQSAPATPVPEEARKWRGAVLVPKNMLLATAHTSKVRIPRIEAHPLDDGNVRIWARVQNPASEPIEVGIACTFRFAGQPAGVSRGFLEVTIPAGGYYDADFLSPHSGVETYTILVRAL